MRRLLVLENDSTVATLLREVLQRRGHEVLVAASGEEALGHLDQGGIDALITDLFLAGLDGLDVVERLARSGNTLPVVVVSGYLDPVAMARMERLPQVRGWLKKPFDLFELLELVEAAASRGEEGASRPSQASMTKPSSMAFGVR